VTHYQCIVHALHKFYSTTEYVGREGRVLARGGPEILNHRFRQLSWSELQIHFAPPSSGYPATLKTRMMWGPECRSALLKPSNETKSTPCAQQKSGGGGEGQVRSQASIERNSSTARAWHFSSPQFDLVSE
jgi:hypothetical protein